MAGEKNEREVVRVENAQYTDGAGGDTHGSGGHTAGAVRVDNAQYNDGAGEASLWGHGWGDG